MMVKLRHSFILIFLLYSFIDSKFYIYEWADEFDDVWPPAGAELHKKSGYNHAFRDNGGAGILLDEKTGLFQTWQFSLYKNVMSRLRVSEHRTRNPGEASAFIIPFDLGVHSYIDHLDGHPRLASPHGWAASMFLVNACKHNKNVYWKNNGHDHFVLFSITAYQMVGIGVKTFFMQVCQNCSVLTIETSPTRTAIKGRTRKYWYGVPYPSSFHWHENLRPGDFPWLVRPQGERPILALIIGSVKTSQPNSNSLRKLLYTQCLADSKHQCQWHKTAHSCSGVVNATSTMLLLRQATYCPAPTGDSITRKSIFDSLVTGCVPVLFSRASLTQYNWHLSEAQVDDVSVYIPMTRINDEGINFLEVLRAIPEEELRRKQLAIEKLAPTLQYSVVPQSAGRGELGEVWRSPFRDAADVIIERINDPKTVEPLTGFTDDQLLYQVNEQNRIMDEHEDYAALRSAGKEGNIKNKEQIAKGRKGISKLLTSETMYYPPHLSIMLSKTFLPKEILRNTTVIEYNERKKVAVYLN